MNIEVGRWRKRPAAVLAVIFLIALAQATRNPASGDRGLPRVTLDEYQVRAVARDGTGRIWGIVPGKRFRLCFWDTSRTPEEWFAVHLDINRDSLTPMKLTAGADGSVVCLWRPHREDQAWVVTQHRYKKSRVFARIGKEYEVREPYGGSDPTVFVDSRGDVWISPVNDGLLRISPDGTVTLAYKFKWEQIRDAYGRGDDMLHTVLDALEDPHGRVWFWGPGKRTSYQMLHGALIHDGESFEYHRTLNGLPDERWSVLEVKDEHTLWLAVIENGLYELDLDTLEATPVPEPEPGAFDFVEDVFSDGDDLYVATATERMPQFEGTGAVWRLRDGVWHQVLDDINSGDTHIGRRPRPWLPVENGLLIGGYKDGMWFVPRDDGEAVHLDWRYGMPLVSVDWLFPLDEGRFLATERNGRAITGTTDAFLDSRDVATGFELLRTHQPLVQTSDGRIWGFLSDNPGVLSEWDGESWSEHPLPEETRSRYPDSPRTDTRDRVWTSGYGDQGHTGIYDPARDSWETYETFEKALEAQIGRHKELAFKNVTFDSVQYSADGRICYTKEPRSQYPWEPVVPSTVRYFDGSEWHTIETRGIGPVIAPGKFPADGPYFFNSAGHLAINIEGTTWAFADNQEWRQVEHEPMFRTVDEYFAAHRVKPPQGCVASRPRSITVDRTGVHWLTWERRLYKAIDGMCVPAFAPDANQPFVDGREVVQALVDGKGATFLLTHAQQRDEYVVMRAASPVPDTEMTVRREGPDTFRLYLSATVPGDIWYRWRLNGGTWSRPSRESEVLFDALPEGDHVVEATALDAQLHIDATPAQATFAVRVTARDIDTWVAALSSSDYDAREAAVKSLVSNPDRALPALEKARATADDDLLWWIDTTIQLIENRRAKK